MGRVKSGCDGVLKLKDSLGEYIAIGEQTSWSLSYSAEANSYRPIGAYYPVRATSNHDWSLSMEGVLDILDDGQVLIDVGECVDFELYPSGEGANEPKYSGTVYIESADTSGSPDDLLPFSASTTGTSTLVAENTWLGDSVAYNITPIADVTGLVVEPDNITINWDAVPGATEYILRYHDGVNNDWDTATSFLTIPLTVTSYVSPIDLDGKTVLVKAFDGCTESENAAIYSVTEFDPASIVGAGDIALILDAADPSTLYQDVLKSTLAGVVEDPVRAIEALPHSGTQCPDMLYVSGSTMVRKADGVSLGANTTVFRSDIFASLGLLNHSNGLTSVAGVYESLEQAGGYFKFQNSGSTGMSRRTNAAGGQFIADYGDAAFQTIVEPRTFGTKKVVAMRGSSSLGKATINGSQIGSDFIIGNPSAGASLIDRVQMGPGAGVSADSILRRYFFINRELTNEEFTNISAWAVA